MLAQAGLTDYLTELERTRCLLRAAALGAPPLIDAFTLGQLVEREGIDVDNARFDDGHELGEALRTLVNAEYSIITKELRSRQGDANLFAALFTSAETDAAYPLSPDFVSEIVNIDMTASKMIA